MGPSDFYLATANSGDNTVIAAPTSPSFIRITGYHLTAKAAVDVTLKSGSTEVDKIYSTSVAGGGIVCEKHFDGVLDLLPGQAFVMNLSTGVAVAIQGKYTIIPTAQKTDWAAGFGS